MKTLFLTLIAAFIALPAFAADKPIATDDWMKPVEAKMVCMVNNKAFDKEQIATQVDGKTYYGCCPMCKGMLEKDAAQRSANDPVSGKTVDKASAVIGSDSDGNTYYFENQDNFKKFASGPKPERKVEPDTMGDMMGKGMMIDMNQKGSVPSETPAPTPKADDVDHTAHHPAK